MPSICPILLLFLTNIMSEYLIFGLKKGGEKSRRKVGKILKKV